MGKGTPAGRASQPGLAVTGLTAGWFAFDAEGSQPAPDGGDADVVVGGGGFEGAELVVALGDVGRTVGGRVEQSVALGVGGEVLAADPEGAGSGVDRPVAIEGLAQLGFR